MLGYPPAVFFMLGNEFCERFSFYGMKSVLTLYLKTEHHMEDHVATLIYHTFIMIAYWTPLLGSVLADAYWGRYKVVYVMGHALLSAGAIPPLSYAIRSILDFGGLFVIAVGTGGIKPCVSAFAADQKLKLHNVYSSSRSSSLSSWRVCWFNYFESILRSLLSTLISPALRGHISCFGSQQCFPLAFGDFFFRRLQIVVGVPGALMVLTLVIFASGSRFYKKRPPEKTNLISKVIGCISTAVKRKVYAWKRSAFAPLERTSFRGEKKESRHQHWLDYASPKYSTSFVDSVKSLVSIAVIYSPFILYWALFDQKGSTWVLQARKLNGRIGSLTILPDQMNTLNPLLILILVPLNEAIFYPLVVQVTPLRKMALGGLLGALSFVAAGMLQLKIDATLGEPEKVVFTKSLQTFNQTSFIELAQEPTVSVLWMLPQYLLITGADSLISSTDVEFAYSQAAPSVKSIAQAVRLSTAALGNMFNMLIAGSQIVPDPAMQFFFFAFWMTVMMIVFIFIATRYVYVEDRASLATELKRRNSPIDMDV